MPLGFGNIPGLVRRFAAFPGANGIGGVGLTMSATGTATAYTVTNTNAFTRLPAVEFLVTTASTTAVAGFRYGANFFSRNTGFYARFVWKTATGMTVATHRAFVGLSATTGAPTDAAPSSLTNIIGMGWDSGDDNVSFIVNDGSGSATKLSLGAGFPRPTADRANAYELEIYSVGSEIFMRARDIINNNVSTATLASDLPATNQLLSPRGYTSVGGTSSVVGIGLAELLIVSR